ncbi:unnamed protein product, partial [Symbiodinium microadriaticum]
SLFAPDMNFNGPVQVIVPSVGLTTTFVDSGASKCVCVVEVRGEEEMVPVSYALSDVPTRSALLL